MNVLKTYLSPTRISQPAALTRGQAGKQLEATSLARVIRVFTAWKALLLLVALLAPGPGYDTSTRILFDQYRDVSTATGGWLAKTIEYMVLRLTRWDAIYFATASERGHVYEQEWAFSWLSSHLTSTITRVLLHPLPSTALVKHALAGILLSHLSHFLAVLLLYNLTYLLIPSSPDPAKRHLAFTSACLHILSPAGLFLSAPNGESTFAFLAFLGSYSYAKAIENRYHRFADAYQLDACWTLLAGLAFSFATLIRTNGLLSGLTFAWDLSILLPRLPQILRNRDTETITHLFATLTAGALIAASFIFPQALAYTEFCTTEASNPRPWCHALPPSIYTYVQAHYWHTGFLAYWTLNNLPLFLLALPTILLLLATSLTALSSPQMLLESLVDRRYHATQSPVTIEREGKVFEHVMKRFALPQLVLVGLGTTSFHVQILNRISSGCVGWVLVVGVWTCRGGRVGGVAGLGAGKDVDGKDGGGKEVSEWTMGGVAWREEWGQWIVRAAVVYAVVQGGLYASFLPPA